MASLKLAFVKCSVLSLQDSCIFYPSCANCLSRLERKQTDQRYRCLKCGLRCAAHCVQYRYRLALSVRRDCHIFALTVFGSCLNPHFGLSALSLHRLVEESKEMEGLQADHVQHLLIKAVENCFIGRCFVFGVKMPGINLDGSQFSGSSFPTSLNSERISGRFIASKIILPDSVLKSFPVVLYFRKLLNAGKHVDLSLSQKTWESSPLPEYEDSASLNDFECTLASHGRSLLQHSDGGTSACGFFQQTPGIIMSPATEENSCTTPEGVVQWHKKMKRCRGSFAHRIPQHLSPQYCSSDIKSECENKHKLDGSCLDSSACCVSADESAKSIVMTDFESNFSLRNSLELSLADGTIIHNAQRTVKSSEILQKHPDQYDVFDLKVGEKGVFSGGKAMVISNMWNSESKENANSKNSSHIPDLNRDVNSYYKKHNSTSESLHDSCAPNGNVSAYATVFSIDHSRIQETSLAEVKPSSQRSNMFQVLKRRESGLSLSLSGSLMLKALPVQPSLTEHQNARGGFSGLENLYNVSADLFCSFEAEENKDMIKASTESEDISQSFNGCPPLNQSSDGNQVLNLCNVKRNRSSCVSEPSDSNSLHFIPFCQSTPISKDLAALKDFRYRRNDQGQFQGESIFTKQHLKWCHTCGNKKVDKCQLSFYESDSEHLDHVREKRHCECLFSKKHSSYENVISNTSAEHDSVVFDLSEDLFAD